MPNMPPWQNQGMGRPPMNIQRFMPPGSGPNRHPGMGQPPPAQMFRGPPPASNNQNSEYCTIPTHYAGNDALCGLAICSQDVLLILYSCAIGWVAVCRYIAR